MDALRGLSIALMFLVTSKNPLVQFQHVHWFGFHLADLVYTCFLFVIGVSLHISTVSQSRKGVSKAERWKKIIIRSGKLFLLGLFLLSASYSRLRFNLGTLQCIAIASLIAFPFIGGSETRKIIGIISIYLAVLLLMIALGDSGVPWSLRFHENHTFSETLDTLILGKPKGEEGVLSTLASVPAVLFGAIAGEFLLVKQNDVRKLVAAGLGLLCCGSFLMLAGIPMSPRLVTPSFSLVASGYAMCLLALFVILLDRWMLEGLFRPLVVIGCNAIAAYVLVKLTQLWIYDFPFASEPEVVSMRTMLQSGVAGIFGETAGKLAFPMLKVLTGYVICLQLFKRQIFFKV